MTLILVCALPSQKYFKDEEAKKQKKREEEAKEEQEQQQAKREPAMQRLPPEPHPLRTEEQLRQVRSHLFSLISALLTVWSPPLPSMFRAVLLCCTTTSPSSFTSTTSTMI